MTENEISEIADDARDLKNALLERGFGNNAVVLTAAAMPVIVSTVLGVVTLADA